jgi:hypothetical protein
LNRREINDKYRNMVTVMLKDGVEKTFRSSLFRSVQYREDEGPVVSFPTYHGWDDPEGELVVPLANIRWWASHWEVQDGVVETVCPDPNS